jgi:hypothetical protein
MKVLLAAVQILFGISLFNGTLSAGFNLVSIVVCLIGLHLILSSIVNFLGWLGGSTKTDSTLSDQRECRP